MANKNKAGGHTALPVALLKKVQKRLGGYLHAAWNGARRDWDNQHPESKGKYTIIKCSANCFCTFGVHSAGVGHYELAIQPLLKPSCETDVWLLLYIGAMSPAALLVRFILSIIAKYMQVFEFPFLKGSHKMGTTTLKEYQAWVTPWIDRVDQWCTTPNDFWPGYNNLPGEYRIVVEMLMDSLHEVVQKHLVSINVADVDEHVDDVLRTTNRWGETVFR